MESKRLFVAVEVPSEIRHELFEFASQLKQDGVKIVEEENLHITLRFIGEVPAAKLPEITERLKKVKPRKIDCTLKGIGVFPNERYISVVWVGVESDGLAELAADVIDQLRGIGKEEDRPFSAHLTIARVKKKIDLKDFLEKNKNKEFGKFTASGFTLFESRLTPKGPIYTPVKVFP